MKTSIEQIQLGYIKFINDEKAMQMGEYAVIGALVLLAAFGAFTALGGNIGTKITEISSHL